MSKGKEIKIGIYGKLAKVQQSLFVPKGNRNNFGGYNYRSCEDILKQVKPLLAENGLCLTMTSNTEVVGSWVYVNVECRLFDVDDADVYISTSAQAREPEMRKGMDAAQVSGSSLSYARKYALAGLFGIDNEKDPDATNDHGAKKTQKLIDAEVDYSVCPLKDPRFFGKKWSEFDADTLQKFLSIDEKEFPKMTAKHKEEIKKFIKN